MSDFLQRLMDNTANLALIEGLRHSKSRVPPIDNPEQTVVMSFPEWPAKKIEEHLALLKTNQAGVEKIDLDLTTGRLRLVMRIPAPLAQVEQAIAYIRKSTQPTRLLPRGPAQPAPLRPKGQPLSKSERQKQFAASTP